MIVERPVFFTSPSARRRRRTVEDLHIIPVSFAAVEGAGIALPRRQRRNRHVAALLATTALVAVVVLMPGAARAQDATWLASPGSGDFNTGANWSPTTVPTDTATFGASGTTGLSFSANTSIGGWTFNALASNYTFTNGQALVFTGAGIAINGGTATIDNNLGTLQFTNSSTAGTANITNNALLDFQSSSTAAGATITTNSNGETAIVGSASGGTARFVLNGTGALDISGLATGGTTAGSIEGDGSVSLGAKNLGVGGNNLSTTFSGVIQDGGNGGGTGGSLTKTGTGMLTLTAANTYSGATTISAGVLNIQNGSALGSTASGTTVASGAALELQNNITVDEALTLNGSGVANGGALRSVAGDNTYSGQITLGSDARINADAGSLFIRGGVGGAGQNLSFGVQTGAVINELSAIATGTGTLTKDGGGLLQLTGHNSYTGVTTVNAGELQLRSGAAIADTGAVVVNASGTLSLVDSETIGSLAGSGDTTLGNFMSGTTLTTGGDNTSTLYSGAIGEDLLMPGSLVKTGAGTFTLAGANTYTGGTTIAGGTLQLGNGGTTGSIAGNVTDNATLAFNRSDAFAFGGVISGSGSLTKTGTGMLTLTAANTYSGATTISAGVLNIQNGSALGSTASGTTVASGAALELQNNITVDEALTLNGSGVANGGALRSVAGDNTYSGQITLGSDARINADAGSLFIRGGVGGAGQNLSFGVQTGAVINELSAIATGTGTLTKDGGGLLQLTGHNSYTGVTTVNAGELQLRSGAAIADTGAVVVNASGTLSLVDSETIGSLAGSGDTTLGNFMSGTTLTTGGDNTSTLYSGAIGEDLLMPGSLVKTGAGTFTLAGANTYTGGTTIAGGTLQLGNGGTTGSIAGNVTDNATLAFNRSDAFAFGGVISGSGSVIQIGAGTTTLSAANTYTGGTTFAGGILNAGSAGALGTVGTLSFTGGTLQYSAANQTDYSGRFSSAANQAYSIDTNGQTITYASALTSAGGSLTKLGTGILILTAANSYIGVTTVNAGNLRLNGGAAIADTGAVVVNASGTLSLDTSETIGSLAGSGNTSLGIISSGPTTLTTGGDNTSTLYSGAIGEVIPGGSLVKTGTGTFTLSGANSYTGGTTFAGGILNAGSAGALGTTGTLSFTGGTLQYSAANQTDYSGRFSTAANQAYSIDTNGQTVTYVSALTSTGGSLTKLGTGTLTLTAANSYIGATTISAGVLNIRNGSALGATTFGTTVADGAALELQNNITVGTEALTLNGSGVGNGGALRSIAGGNTYSGQITLGSDARITADAGNLNIYGGIGGAGHNLSFGVQTGASIDVDRNITTGTGTLTKDGNGVLRLQGHNSYTGVTTVNAGELMLANGAAIADTGAVVVNAPGTLALDSSETIGSLAGSGTTTLGAGLGSTTLTTGGDNTSTLYSGGIGEGGTVLGLVRIGSLVKTGAGTFTLAGANTYTGTTDVNAGTLAVTGSIGSVATPAGAIGVLAGATLSVGAAGSINIAGHDLTNAGTVTVASGGSITDDLVNSGIVSNAGTYNAKVASNTGSITNASIWNGDVLSNAGSIVNDAGAIWTGNVSTGGSFSNDGTISGAVTVSGGTFKGAGSSGGLAIGSGAVFAPGNGTPGTSATVNGSLAFSSGAFYQVAINPITASFVNATGTATLGGASVQAFFSSGTYVAKQYTILHATGGVSGTFNTLANTNLPSGFTSTLSYDGTHAYLDLALNLTPGPNFGGGLTVNQRNVATTLVNFFNSNGSIPIVFGALTPAGLTQASGELATATQQTSFDAMNLFMGVMTDPFAGGRGGVASSGSAAGYADADAYAAKRKPNDALAAIYTKARPMTPTFAQRWSTWVAGYGGSQSTDGNAALGSNNTTSSVYGTAVGADYRLSLDTVAGFALAGGGTNFNVNGAGYGRSDLFQAGAFLRHTHGPAYITSALAYGWQDITTNRTVMVAGIDRLRAQFNANAWSGRVEGGTRFVAPLFGGVGLTPYAAGQVTTFDLPSYTESVLAGAGAFALSYNARSVTDTRSELGLRTDKSYAMESGILTLRGRTAWAHDFNPDRSIAATFQTLPGASFVVNGAAQAPDSLLSSEAIEFKWTNGWSVAATFDSEYSSVATSYAGKGVVRYTW